MNVKRVWATMVIAVLPVSLSACSGGSDDSGSGDEIVIGAVQPMTGTASIFGKGVVGALKNDIKLINADGGVTVAGKDYRLKLEVFDDGGVPDKAQAAVREATGKGIKYFIGPFGSATAKGAYSLMARADAVWVINTANSPGLTDAPNTVRTTMKIDQYDEATLSFLAKHPELTTVSITTDQAHAGLADRTDQFIQDVKALGRDVVVTNKHQPGDTDFRSAITKMEAAGTDFYSFRGYPAEQIQFFKQVRELAGAEPWIGGIAGTSTAETEKAFPDQDVLANTILAGPRGSLDTFVAAGDERAITMNEQLQPEPGGMAVLTVDGLSILAAALESADELTPKAVEKALAELPADQVNQVSFNQYEPQDAGRLFKDREVRLSPDVTVWKPGTGWVLGS